MKKLVALFLLVAATLPAAAVEEGQVMYVGGTVPNLTANLVGRLDSTSEISLTFEYSNNKLAIPYAAIQSFEYSTEVTHHLGVLPAIAVGLLKKRERRHFFRIAYLDADHTSQVVVFEVPKRMPRTLQAVLEARAPQTCRPHSPCAGGIHNGQTRDNRHVAVP
jgi:hypothetical protein